MTVDELIYHIKTRNRGAYPYLYHMTDQSNWESIAELGLLSTDQRQVKGIHPTYSAANDLSKRLDREKGITNYVCLSFSTEHKLSYIAIRDKRIVKPFRVEIEPEILHQDGVLYSSGVANASDSELVPICDQIRNIKFCRTKRDVHMEKLLGSIIPESPDDGNNEILPYTEMDINYNITHRNAEILIPNFVPKNMLHGI